VNEEGRQIPKSADVRFDWVAAGPAVATHTHTGVISLPAGARVTGGEIVVDLLFATTGTATIDVGDGLEVDRYTTSAPVDLETAARTALSLDGFRYVENDGIKITIVVGAAVTTAGLCYVRVEYVVDGRADGVQE
jgi:hypothetical protein